MNIYLYHMNPEILNGYKKREVYVPNLAVSMARYKGQRNPDAEPYIMKAPIYAMEYVRDVLKGQRWPEAEPYIMKSPYTAYEYAHEVLKKRWPEAESYILKDAESAMVYAIDLIKGKWPEAEPIMKTENNIWRRYCQWFGIKPQ